MNVHSTDMRDVAVRTLHGRMMGPRWIEVRRLHFARLFSEMASVGGPGRGLAAIPWIAASVGNFCVVAG